MEKKIGILLTAALICCVLLGGILGFRWGEQHMALEKNEIEYGISEQDLHIYLVEWKDYPAWREVSFSIDGSISFITGQNGSIILDGLTNPDALEETQREHNVSTNGKDLIYFDAVTYVINEGAVRAAFPKVYNRNVIIDTVCNSFYIVFREEDTDYIAGSISPLDKAYKVWTGDEVQYFDTNIDAYLSAYTLSGTYADIRPLREKAQKEGVVLRKEEGNFLNCTVYNNGSEVWCYEAQLPHVELWYKGVWIELTSPFADNLMTVMIEPDQNRGFNVPEEIIMQYPTLIGGIYRLVIYGENEDFVVSDTFIVES
ncbi:MAG: hypothetical protein K2N44_10630 [Lachnospiraceae bacterium]|nr:hypothetical protein [Lachnospiraceae bacterium]